MQAVQEAVHTRRRRPAMWPFNSSRWVSSPTRHISLRGPAGTGKDAHPRNRSRRRSGLGFSPGPVHGRPPPARHHGRGGVRRRTPHLRVSPGARCSPTSSSPTSSTGRPPKVQSSLLEAMQERCQSDEQADDPTRSTARSWSSPRRIPSNSKYYPTSEAPGRPVPHAALDRLPGPVEEERTILRASRRTRKTPTKIEVPGHPPGRRVPRHPAGGRGRRRRPEYRGIVRHVDLVGGHAGRPRAEVGASPRGSLALLQARPRPRAPATGRDYVVPGTT